MNFINVKASRDGGRLALRNDNVELPVPDRLAPSVEKAGDELTAGVRPEHFEIGDAKPNAAKFRTTVDVVEFLGNEELLHVRLGEHDLVAIVDASHRVRPGDVLDLSVPMEKLHIFEEESGTALTSRIATA